MKALKLKSPGGKKHQTLREILSIFDLLLAAEPPNRTRPIDIWNSSQVPAPKKLGFASRHLSRPFHVCHAVERRKAMAVVLALLNNNDDAFSFVTHVPLGQRIREAMSLEKYERLERHILNIARLAFSF